MRLLIIEDNIALASNMRALLSNYYVVDISHNGTQALNLIEEHNYDLLILDLHLPDMLGSQICATLREQDMQMPILIVTADHSPSGVVDLLNAGADDYICKPFRSAEFKARVKALLRRQVLRQPAANIINTGNLQLNIDDHSAIYDGRKIALRSKEFLILEQLMRHPNMALSRASLLSKVWDEGGEPWPTIIDAHVKNLRRKIAPEIIETVHGFGYRITST